MNLNAALDVITGLVLMYLLLSLFCTAINEIIAWVTNQRAKTLRTALQQLIDDPRLQALFYDHGLIDGTKVAATGGSQKTKTTAQFPAVGAPGPAGGSAPPAQDHPSYLSGETVAAALTSSLVTYLHADNDPASLNSSVASLQAAISSLKIDSNIRDTLSACLADAGQNVDKFRTNVAQWFDNSMDRLSGVYKRYIQIVSFVVGVIIAIALNADTLHVSSRLWSDHTLGDAITQSAAALVKNDGKVTNGDCTNAAQGATGDLSNSITKICALNAALRPLPIGWPAVSDWSKFWSQPSVWDIAVSVILKIVGLLITAVALMQGAPFWFDLLQKITNFRATGAKPKKAADPS